MKILNLIEDTKGRSDLTNAHGLSFYIETKMHKIILDLGPSEDTIHNARTLDVDLAEVDTVILSHGHYDHSGGIIPFTKINDKAIIYMQDNVTKEYYADDGQNAIARYRYIGIDKDISNLSQVRFVNGDFKIDDELELFVINNKKHEIPFTNRRLLVKEGDTFKQDDFNHEHFLVVHQNGKSYLMSGCAHNGMLNIIEEYIDRYGTAPDVVVSGFHLAKKKEYSETEVEEIRALAEELKKYPTRFVTCHCTGMKAFGLMKEIMGDKLEYVHTGEEINMSHLTF